MNPHTARAQRLLILPLFYALLLTDAPAAWQNGQTASLAITTALSPDKTMTSPQGLAADIATGKLFVTDSLHHRILRFSSQAAMETGAAAEAVLGQTDFVSTQPGTGPARLNIPRSLFCDLQGRLWVSDAGNRRVLRFDGAATLPSGSPASAVLGQPDFDTFSGGTSATKMGASAGLVVDGTGRLWVADPGNARVLWFNNAATRPNGAAANGVVGQSGFNTSLPGNTASGMDFPIGVAVEGGFHGVPLTLWVADSNNHRVVRFDNAGNLPSTGAAASGVLGQPDFNTFATAPDHGMLQPDGLALDGNGRLWVADTGHNRVLKFNNARYKSAGNLTATADGIIGQYSLFSGGTGGGASGLNFPRCVAVLGDHLWVADAFNNRVLHFAGAANLPNNPPADSALGIASFTPPLFDGKFNAMAICPVTGKLFVSEYEKHRVLRFANTAALAADSQPEAVLGQGDFYSVTPGTTAVSMNSPIGLTVDSAGRLWVCDAGNHRVLRFDNAAFLSSGAPAKGVIGQDNFTSKVTGNSALRCNSPRGVATDPAGNLWVADSNNNRVLRFAAAAATNSGAAAVQVLGQSTWGLSSPGLSAPRFDNPAAVAADASGHLWVADAYNNRVVRFDNAAMLPNGASAAAVLGQPDFTTGAPALGAAGMESPQRLGLGAAGRLWVVTSQSRVLRFENAAGLFSHASAKGVLGQPDFTTKNGSLALDGLMTPLGVAEDAQGRVWIADSFARRLTAYAPYLSTTITASGVDALGHYFVKWLTAPGIASQLQVSTDLQTWSNIGQVLISPGFEMVYLDPLPVTASVRKFFRIVEP